MKRAMKEEILQQSLRLFSMQGYDGVSMRDIAASLSIRQSSLYKHYAGKQAILESIVARMTEETERHKAAMGFPSGGLPSLAAGYGQRSIQTMQALGEQLYRYWTEDPFASAFRRLLILEQYRSEEMSRLFYRYMIAGVLEHHAALFAEMMRQGYFRQGDAQLMAAEFYGPVFLWMCAFDHAEHREELVLKVRAHIEQFGKRWVTEA